MTSDLGELYQGQRAALTRLAYLLTGSPEVAEDLVQDVFERVAERLDGVADPVAYLRRGVVNASHSWHRRRYREVADLARRRPMAVAGPEHDDMWEALRKLSPRRRSVLVVRYYLDLSEAETAAVLGWRIGTVKSVSHRALGDLRKMLTP